jgi:hypothetical protein
MAHRPIVHFEKKPSRTRSIRTWSVSKRVGSSRAPDDDPTLAMHRLRSEKRVGGASSSVRHRECQRHLTATACVSSARSNLHSRSSGNDSIFLGLRQKGQHLPPAILGHPEMNNALITRWRHRAPGASCLSQAQACGFASTSHRREHAICSKPYGAGQPACRCRSTRPQPASTSECGPAAHNTGDNSRPTRRPAWQDC